MVFTETFSTSTVFLKICMVLTPLQTLIYIIGFSTKYWVKNTLISITLGPATGGLMGGVRLTSGVGLWKMEFCGTECITSEIPNVTDWLYATRAFATIGLIGFLLTTAGVFVLLFVKELAQRRILHILTTLLAAGTGVCVLIAVVIFGINYNNPDHDTLITDKDPYWSYALCVVALVLDIIATILLVLNAIKKPIV